MNIQWFPGHMTRARREIEQKLGLLDIVIELLDARIPFSSRNPMIDDILQGKKRLVVLNKADLADPQTTEEWIQFFREDQGLNAIPIDSAKGTGTASVITHCEQLLSEQRERQRSKGIHPRAMRGLIVGIPNVGKSTLINRLAGRQIAETGDRPGVTKGQQWIKVGKTMELLDTPGILWPKFEDPQVGLRLAITGAIKHNVLDVEEVAFEAVKWMLSNIPDRMQERYSLDSIDADIEDPIQIVNLMEDMGRQRGCLRSGGQIDLEKISGIILRELRSGKLGRYSLERPTGAE